jgi:hypothetical protein
MVRDWFKGAKALTVNELILRKDYEKAIELISDSTIEATIRGMPQQ